MNRLTYDTQGFIVGIKKNGQLGEKIRQDTSTIVALLRQSAKQQPTKLYSSQQKTKTKASSLNHRLVQKVRNTNPKTKQKITQNKTHASQMATIHRTNEKLKAKARQILPKSNQQKPSKLSNAPKQSVGKQEITNDNKTLRLLERMTVQQQRRRGGILGGLLTALSFIPFAKIFKGGKWLLKLAKRNPVLSVLMGGVALLTNWHKLDGASRSKAIGKLAFGAGGAIAGAMIGQAIIPIPVVGALIGGMVGGYLGSFVGETAGGGLYAIATNSFTQWLSSFGAVGKGLLSLWDKGINPLITGATDALTWIKDKLLSFFETAKGVYDTAVENTTDLIEKMGDGATSLWNKGKEFLGVGGKNTAGMGFEMAILGKDYATHHKGYFGAKREYRNGIHMGQDYSTPVGTKVFAPENGIVTKVNTSKHGGKMVTFKADSGYTYKFAHLSKQPVGVGTRLNAGQVVAISGDTGRGNAHLHAEIIDPKGKHVDPKNFKIPSSPNRPSSSQTQDKSSSSNSPYHQEALAVGKKYHKIGTINENELVTVGNQKIHKDAYGDYRRMADDFYQATGKSLQVLSGYRSVTHQQSIIDKKKKQGLSNKQIYGVSAPAGHSEHQTGLAMDFGIGGSQNLTNTGVWADNSRYYAWLRDNAHKYGFRQTYTKGNAQGISQENWHWAWIGNDKALKLLGGQRPSSHITSSTLGVPTQPQAIADLPVVAAAPKTQAKTTTVITQATNKANDRDLLHKVV